MFSFLKKALGTETEGNASSSAKDTAKTSTKAPTLLKESGSNVQANSIPTGPNSKEITTADGLSATVEVLSPSSPDVEDIDVPESEILASTLTGVASGLTFGDHSGAASKTGLANNLTEVLHVVPAQLVKEEVKLTEDFKKITINAESCPNSDTVDAKGKTVPMTVADNSDVIKSLQTAASTEVQTTSTAPVPVTQILVKDNSTSGTPSKTINDSNERPLDEVNTGADDDDDILNDSWKTVISPFKDQSVIGELSVAEGIIDSEKTEAKQKEFDVALSSVNMSKPITITEDAVSAKKSENSPANIIAIEPLKVMTAENPHSIIASESASDHIDLPKVADPAPKILKETPLFTEPAPSLPVVQSVSLPSTSKNDVKGSNIIAHITTESAHDSSALVSHSVAPIKPLLGAEDKIEVIPLIALPSTIEYKPSVTKNTVADVEVDVEVKAEKNEDAVIITEKIKDVDGDVKAVDDEKKVPLSETDSSTVQISATKCDAIPEIPKVVGRSVEGVEVPAPLVISELISDVTKVKEETKKEAEVKEEEVKEEEVKKDEVKKDEVKEVDEEEEVEVKKEEVEVKMGVEVKKEVQKKEAPIEIKDGFVKSIQKEREIIVIGDSDDDNYTVEKVPEKVVYIIDDSDDDDDDEPTVRKSTAPPVVYTIDDDDDNDNNVATPNRKSGSRPYRTASKPVNPKCPGLEAWETCINELDELEVLAREMQRDREEEEDEDDDDDEDGNDEQEGGNGDGGDGDGDGEEDQWSDYNEELNDTADANDDYDVNEEENDDILHRGSTNDQKDICADEEIEGVYLSDDEADEGEQDRGNGGGRSYLKDNGSNRNFPSSPPGLPTGKSKGAVIFN